MFKPHLLVVQEGTTVEFQNDDSVQHNVFWPSVGGNRKAGHNLGTWPKGEKRPFKFDQPGVVPLLCNVHPEMSGYIVVSPRHISRRPMPAATTRSTTFPTASTPSSPGTKGSKQQTKPVM